MLQFPPKSEEEILALLPDGEYDYLVKNAAPHRSQAGNESTKLLIAVYKPDGDSIDITVYLSPNYLLLIKHFCESNGLDQAYLSGKLDTMDCINRTGRCKVIIEQPKEGTNFLPKNVIKDFIKNSSATPPVAPVENNEFKDDDLPF